MKVLVLVCVASANGSASMAAAWKKTDGDIAQVLASLFASAEFTASLGKKFKDPMHYAVSAVRAVSKRLSDLMTALEHPSGGAGA